MCSVICSLVSILEIARLSLDEPELEGVFFNDDDHLGDERP